ncbi:MAG: tripartite tricarboxylate transporter substrate-binding protein, partial [Xanthobacteraceae bacterium]
FIAGAVPLGFQFLPNVAAMLSSGDARPLAVTSNKRMTALPQVPTAAEAGVANYETFGWLALLAPAGTPKPIVDKLNAEIHKVLARDDLKEAWAKQGAVPMQMAPEEFDKYLRTDIEKWAHVVKVSGATVQ